MKSILFALACLLVCLPARAVAAVALDDLISCPVTTEKPPVRFDDPGCRPVKMSGLDTQGRDLWLQGRVDVSKAMIDDGPLGLYVLAKASSEAYLNGVRLGANGTPGTSRADETPGRMNAVFSLPPHLLRAGDNEIVLRLSSFHGVVRLSQPVHMLAVAPYVQPADLLLRAYWPSLVTFGVLLAGAFFFASTAVSAVNRRDPLLLALMSLLAAAQLFAEVYRALVPYAYPIQDWRLIVITTCAAAFGLTLAALVSLRYAAPRPLLVFGAVAAITLTPVVILPGFDGKAAFSILAAATACAVIAGRAALKGDRWALAAGLGLAVFAGSILVFEARFLDTVFFYEVAALILVLFTVRVLMFERERRDHEKMRMRAHDLELALARAMQAKKPSVLRLTSAGAVTIVNTSDITLCKGADDYVELHLADGRTLLHNGALGELEMELPASFLRVHRSFIVNTAFVEKLTREATGVGMLTLSNGTQAPVSRRIMPRVRDALG